MPFTPPRTPLITDYPVKISIESVGNSHRVLVENADSHPKTLPMQSNLSIIGWQITQMLGNGYAVELDGVGVNAITNLYKQIMNEYGLLSLRLDQANTLRIDSMITYKTTELVQLWKHSSGQVIGLDAIAPIDEEDETAEYTYGSQGSIMGSESELVASGWTKIDESEYIGITNSN
jgi:hypothetical protein